MSEVNAFGTMLVRFGFTQDAARYMVSQAGLDCLAEVGYLDDDDAENLANRVTHSDGSNTVGTGMDAVTTANMGFTVSIRDDSNLHLCMFYLRHCTRTPHTPNVALLDLDRVRGFHDQRKWEENFKKTTVEPVINDKDWPRALENIREFLVSILGDTRVPLAYVIQADHIVPLYATDPADTYLTVDQDMTYRAPYSGTIFRMTSAMFGITWPTSATHMNAGFMSSLRSK
jgi:hypothetical protein